MRIAQCAEESNFIAMEEESTPLSSVPVNLNIQPEETLVADPLSSVARNERRSLLLLSVIGIAIVKTGLVPSKIEALGIEFSPGDQKSLLNILGMVNVYLLLAFSIYALTDFIGWRVPLNVKLANMNAGGAIGRGKEKTTPLAGERNGKKRNAGRTAFIGRDSI